MMFAKDVIYPQKGVGMTCEVEYPSEQLEEEKPCEQKSVLLVCKTPHCGNRFTIKTTDPKNIEDTLPERCCSHCKQYNFRIESIS